MDGVFVIDKPQGPTSHDIVAAARRRLGESRIGHAGTLDPMATGVLALACGRATRLIRFLTASDKDYDAGITFGFTTDSYDVTGEVTSRSDAVPSRDGLEGALESLRGEYLQMPPPYSAKKIGGERAYALARRREAVELTPVPVRVSCAEILEYEGGRARIRLTCSSGFYVRAFAHSLGERVGTGACLASLRRTRSGDFHLTDAIGIEQLTRSPQEWPRTMVPLEQLLPAFPSATLSEEGRRRVSHGQTVLVAHIVKSDGSLIPDAATPEWVRLFDIEGHLVGLGTAVGTSGSLHPAVVLI
jgi:tRNA pseudouridine55 synthase